MRSSILIVTSLLLLVGCGKKPSIIGVFKDTTWSVKDRVDTWEFKDDGTWSRETRFEHLGRPTNKALGTYTYDGKRVTLKFTKIISYQNDGSTREHPVDASPSNAVSMSVKVDGTGFILDDEQKSDFGRTILKRVP